MSSMSILYRLASARKPTSFMVASNAARSTFARSAGTPAVGGEAGDEAHMTLAGQQPRVDGEAGLPDAAEPLFHLGQGPLDEVLQVLPASRVPRSGENLLADYHTGPQFFHVARVVEWQTLGT